MEAKIQRVSDLRRSQCAVERKDGGLRMKIGRRESFIAMEDGSYNKISGNDRTFEIGISPFSILSLLPFFPVSHQRALSSSSSFPTRIYQIITTTTIPNST